MFGRGVRRFLRDPSGAVFVQIALVFMALSGMAGLAIDVGYWYSTQRAMQTAADSAAMAAAYEALWGGDTQAIEDAAKASAARNGFGPTTVTVNPGYGSPDAVEVVIQQGSPGMFSSLIMNNGSLDIAARAVAGRVDGKPVCVLALEPSGTKGIHMHEDTTLTATGCIVQVNSSSGSAIDADEDATLSAEAIGVVGGVSGGAALSPSPETSVGVITDPLAYLEPPEASYGSCTWPTTYVVSGGSATLSPGVYCGGIDISGGADVTFQAGIYVLRDGRFEASGGASLQGDGVGIYLTGSGAVVDISGGTQVDLSAPTEGDMAGLVFYQGPDAPTFFKSEFSGSTLEIEGALYFPDQRLDLAGGSTTPTVPPFTLIIARSLHIHDASVITVDSDFASSAVPVPLAFGRYSIAVFE